MHTGLGKMLSCSIWTHDTLAGGGMKRLIREVALRYDSDPFSP